MQSSPAFCSDELFLEAIVQSGLKRPVAELKLKPLGRSLIETLRTHIRALLKPSEPTSRSPIETFEISRTQTYGSMCSKNSPSPRVSFATQLEPNSRTGALEAALAQPENDGFRGHLPSHALKGSSPGPQVLVSNTQPSGGVLGK